MSHISRAPTPSSSFQALPYPEQMALWAIRMWVRAYRNDDPMLFEAVHGAMRSAGVDDRGTSALDGFMSILAMSTTVSIDIRCPRCGDVSMDEQRLLAALADAQMALPPNRIALSDTATGITTAILEVWMPPAALRLAETPLSDAAKELTKAEMTIRPRPWILQAQIDGEKIDYRGARPRGALH